jgi:phage gp36-like protein
MAYTTRAAVEIAVGGPAKLVQLADLNNDTAEDAGVVDAAIAEADSMINSYAGKRYAVPFATTSPTIASLATRIAARVLRRNRGMPWPKDFDEAEVDRLWLVDLARGLVTPGVEPTPEKSSLEVDDVYERDTGRAISRKKFDGYS